MLIITLLLGSMLVPLQTQVESRKQEETVRILEQARDALLGYAATYGYLPCPADYGLNSNGAEAAGSDHTTGVCDSAGADSVLGGGTAGVYIGYLPAVTLGFTPTDANGYAVDGWGIAANRIRYAVSGTSVNSTANCTATAITNPFTKTGGIRSATMSCVMNTTLLSVCTTATGTTAFACASAPTRLTDKAIAVIWSLGPNAGTSGGTSTDEAENAEALASADRVFIKRDYSNVTGAEFDDIVTWISPPTLFNRLLAAGQLP